MSNFEAQFIRGRHARRHAIGGTDEFDANMNFVMGDVKATNVEVTGDVAARRINYNQTLMLSVTLKPNERRSVLNLKMMSDQIIYLEYIMWAKLPPDYVMRKVTAVWSASKLPSSFIVDVPTSASTTISDGFWINGDHNLDFLLGNAGFDTVEINVSFSMLQSKNDVMATLKEYLPVPTWLPFEPKMTDAVPADWFAASSWVGEYDATRSRWESSTGWRCQVRYEADLEPIDYIEITFPVRYVVTGMRLMKMGNAFPGEFLKQFALSVSIDADSFVWYAETTDGPRIFDTGLGPGVDVTPLMPVSFECSILRLYPIDWDGDVTGLRWDLAAYHMET